VRFVNRPVSDRGLSGKRIHGLRWGSDARVARAEKNFIFAKSPLEWTDHR